MNGPYLGLRPRWAEIWSVSQERVCQVILPPGTRLPTARRAVDTAVRRWLDALLERQHLELISDIEIEGPFLCPWADRFGDDLWLARGKFRSLRPRLVPEDVVVASRRLAEDAGVPYEQYRREVPPLPEDWRRQLTWIGEHADAVYGDLKQVSPPDVAH